MQSRAVNRKVWQLRRQWYIVRENMYLASFMSQCQESSPLNVSRFWILIHGNCWSHSKKRWKCAPPTIHVPQLQIGHVAAKRASATITCYQSQIAVMNAQRKMASLSHFLASCWMARFELVLKMKMLMFNWSCWIFTTDSRGMNQVSQVPQMNVLTNAENTCWRWRPLRVQLSLPLWQKKLLEALVSVVRQDRMDGVDFNVEEMDVVEIKGSTCRWLGG